MQFHDFGDDGFHGGIVPDKLHGLVDHQIFQPLFADGFLLAALLLFGSGTFIVAVDFSRPARTAFAKHQRTAAATVQLGCQQVIVLCLSPGRGFLVFGNLFLHIIEQFQRHDGRNRIRHDHIPEFQFSDITPVFEHVLHAVVSKFASDRVLDAVFIQPVPNLFHREAIPILRERFQHERGGKRVDVKFPLGIQRISKRSTTTVAAAFQDVLCLSTDNLFGKVGRVVFCIALQNRFQNDTLWPLGDDLRSRHELDTVLFQLVLVVHGIEPIPGKAVQLPDQNYVEDFLSAVLDHPLKVWAVIRFGRVGTVNVGADHGDAVLLGVVLAVAQLSLNGRFTLAVG